MIDQEQKKVIEATEKTIVILAPPGSGKTATIAWRVNHLVHAKKIPPSQIKIISYTNDAVNHMRRVLNTLIDDKNNNVQISTFDGMIHDIVRFRGEKYTILSDAERNGILTQLSALYNVKKTLLQSIITRNLCVKGDLSDSEIEIMRDYFRLMKKIGKYDYDVYTLYVANFLSSAIGATYYYAEKYKYLFVDEAQDLTPRQLRVLSLIHQGSPEHNIVLVGDDDQSIYGYRGCSPLMFVNYFENRSVYQLTHNYRSTKEVISAAQSLINHNQNRLRKKIEITKMTEYGNVTIINSNRQQQYYRILELMKKIPKDDTVGILSRYSVFLLPVADLLLQEGYPSMYCHVTDDFSYNHNTLTSYYLLLYDAIANERNMKNVLKPKKYNCALELIKEKTASAIELNKCILGILQDLGLCTSSKTETDILNIICSFIEKENIQNKGLCLLNRLALLLNYFSAQNSHDDHSYIKLSTLHSAKGKQYDHVIIIDVGDGIFPVHKKRVTEADRRLLYVGMTRAEKTVTIFKIGDSQLLEQISLKQ